MNNFPSFVNTINNKLSECCKFIYLNKLDCDVGNLFLLIQYTIYTYKCEMFNRI